jgi:hypothetical protein
MVFIIYTPLTSLFASEPAYDFASKEDIELYTKNLKTIGMRIPIWPPIEEMIACSKRAVIETLDHIAKTVTKTVRPKTEILPYPVTWVPKNSVLKRERSDAARHCLLPADMKNLTIVQLNEYLESHSSDDCHWLLQEYVPFLRQFGEWRVYFIDGFLSFTLLTEWMDGVGIVSIKQLNSWSLEELTSVSLILFHFNTRY